MISAVGKSAYRALTKFTREEKEQICRYVVEKVNELEVDEVPIPIMHNIVESALEQVKPVVAKATAIIVTISRILYGCWMMSTKEPVHHVHRRQGKCQHGFRTGIHQAQPDLQSAEQGTVPEVLPDHGRDPGLPGRLYLCP